MKVLRTSPGFCTSPRHVAVGSGDCHSGDERPLDECVPVDVVGDVGFDAALLNHVARASVFTGNNRAAVCAPIDEAEKSFPSA